MNFFQRALANISRKKTKSILILITFFVIGNFVIIGLGVSQAATSAKTLTRQKMRAVVSYEIDYDAIREYTDSITDQDELDAFYRNYPSVKTAEVSKFLDDERVKTANAIVTSQLYKSDDVDFVHIGNKQEENNSGTSCNYNEEGEEYCYEDFGPSFSMKANYFPNMIELVDGDFKITSGRFYTQEEINNKANVTLVSDAFAAANGLTIGSRFKVYLTNPNEIKDPKGYYGSAGITIDDVTLELEVIGTFSHNKQVTPNSPNFDWISPYENYDNVFLMPASAYVDKILVSAQKYFDNRAQLEPENEYYQNPDNRPSIDNQTSSDKITLLLNDPLEVDSFVKDHSGDLPQFRKLSANNEEFQRLAKPLDTLSLYSNFIVWLVVINAVVIITLVTALTLKTREYEIGVLLSVGASKMKVVLQFFTELAIVAILGFSLAVISGSAVATKVGETVLEYQLSASDVNSDQNNKFDTDYYPGIWDDNYTTDVTLDDIVSEYRVSISPLIIGEIYIVGLGIVLVSTIIPSLMIMRYNPKQILMNQN